MDPHKAAQPICCYRCGAEVAPERFDSEGWAVIHAWQDGEALFVCPRCQTDPEREASTETSSSPRPSPRSAR